MAGSRRLTVDGLRVAFGGVEVVRGVSFTLDAGECVALVGESGSGKSVTARALLGLAGGTVTADALTLDDTDLAALGERDWRRIRGPRIGLVLQDALVSLDPLRPIAREIDDPLRLHSRLTRPERAARVLEVLDEVSMPSPETRSRQRSGELSGGLRQRALIAAALALRPGVLIADEPTTALDAEVQRQVVDRLARLRDEGTSVLAISHDLGAVRRLADRVVVLRDGEAVEQGPTEQILDAPTHPYTQALVAALPHGKPRGTRLSAVAAGRRNSGTPTPQAPTAESSPVVLSARRLTRRFGDFTAVDDVSLELRAGETLGLVGASGSGKTTTARLLLGLDAPDAGQVALLGAPWNPLPERERRPRRAALGAVYQDALSSFDPRMTVGRILVDALTAGRATRPGRARLPDVERMLREVGLDPAVAARLPRTLSGGQRQRVAIARALAPSPRVVVCDEPVSSLDVTVQAQVLDLLDELQRERGLAYVFISHDLDVVRHQSDRVAVMSAGRVVEQGPAEQVFTAPEHPYTRALLAAAT
ncbi:peptide/nickel transport system ATP-binding protein [Frondihabitans sp. PhB188]|uniref:dipeptide ABC transporter ATP-binding protein n=1 Tax=Frondihabitans sp. PhB188 TaxID=2485200 RepID=UPI000F472EE3|nr:ABC transporter ATP-binding protein [Frondihabitans sp. PhB188]ROQ38296.1 peptide/nickel transport system ATP-binding protein [Frondihabitans sp. PhB188]